MKHVTIIDVLVTDFRYEVPGNKVTQTPGAWTCNLFQIEINFMFK